MSSSHSLWHHTWRRLRRNKTAVFGLVIFSIFLLLAVIGPFMAPQDYRGKSTDLRRPPSAAHWFGTDALGRDVLSRILVGAAYTLGVGLATIAIGVGIGVPLGLVSGFLGGRWDQLIMRVMDVLLSFPDILLALALVAALGASLRNAVLAIGVIFIPKFARITRASALQEKSLDYISAARAMGCGPLRIMFRHLLPNCVAPIIVMATLGLASAILQTSALSFLGLGARPPLPEWGAMLNEGKEYYASSPHIMLFPGLAIALSVLGINLFGDGLRDALDVKLGK
jgi:ABC-type dipeptide/oligopeptide/nickel transport system permease subunit